MSASCKAEHSFYFGACLLFTDLHTEVSRSWKKSFSSRALSFFDSELEGELLWDDASSGRDFSIFLFPNVVSYLNAPTLPAKPCRTTPNVGGRAYIAAGQAGACLHTKKKKNVGIPGQPSKGPRCVYQVQPSPHSVPRGCCQGAALYIKPELLV